MPQHRDLMPEDQGLRVLSGATARKEHQPAKHSDHEETAESDEHERGHRTADQPSRRVLARHRSPARKNHMNRVMSAHPANRDA